MLARASVACAEHEPPGAQQNVLRLFIWRADAGINVTVSVVDFMSRPAFERCRHLVEQAGVPQFQVGVTSAQILCSLTASQQRAGGYFRDGYML
jgi:hypothetical protein